MSRTIPNSSRICRTNNRLIFSGVQAAMQDRQTALADHWICHIRDIIRDRRTMLETIDDPALRFDKLCELNVVEQVRRMCGSTIVQNAWQRGNSLCVHGWIYQLGDGLLRDLDLSITAPEEIEPTIDAALQKL